jgi:hypothetical protein
VLAVEDADQYGKELCGVIERERSFNLELMEKPGGFRGDGVFGLRGDALNGVLKLRGESFGVQLRDEELGDVFGVVGLSVGAAGHAQALKRVDAVEHVAERTEDAGDGLLSGGKAAHA